MKAPGDEPHKHAFSPMDGRSVSPCCRVCWRRENHPCHQIDKKEPAK